MAPDDVKSTSRLVRPLTNAKINDIWHSGFCDETIEHARLTTEADSQARIDFLRIHLKTCADCRNANIMKTVEHETAKLIGPEAEKAFLAGQDVTQLDGFQGAFHQTITSLIKSGVVDHSYFHWMHRVAGRAGKDYMEYRRGQEADET